MIATIEKGTAYGRVEAPPSKSVSHRYLICGALSGGSVMHFQRILRQLLIALAHWAPNMKLTAARLK